MKRLCILLIRFYRRFISPLKPSCCRFTPTCSAYALDAFKYRGFFVGFGLMVARICRCNPYCKAGYDPVPRGCPKKRIDLIRMKMGKTASVCGSKKGVSSTVVTVERKKKKRKVADLPYTSRKETK